MKIDLRIDRLVLDGAHFEGMQGRLIQTSVERELTRLLSAGGSADFIRASGVWDALSMTSVKLMNSNDPAELGRQIAASLHDGFGNPT